MTSVEPIEFYGSLQSPYCYFALNRLTQLSEELSIPVVMRSVLPGVIRIPDSFSDRSELEKAYFDCDVDRTAQFLDLDFSQANPSPVNWIREGSWVAAPQQDRVLQLYNMLFAASQQGREFQLYAALMRSIWSGKVKNWHRLDHLARCLMHCDLPETLVDQPNRLLPQAETYFETNDRAMNTAGHWGVPLFCWDGEPFYGQDRLNQLAWRIRAG